jgi:hypothetical protein
MSDECNGINYALRLRGRALEVRARPFRDKTVTIELNRIKSIELLRKSVMPPAMIGAICLSLGLILRIAEDGLNTVVPLALRIPLQSLTIALASVCLVILLARWFFSNLILRPIDAPPIAVRMVPTNSARRFVMLVQKKGPTAEVT